MVMFVCRRKCFMRVALLSLVLIYAAACASSGSPTSSQVTRPFRASSTLELLDSSAITDDVAQGDAALWETDFASAEAAYRRALQTTADFGSLYGRLAFLYVLQPERWQEAATTAQKAVDLARDDAEAWAYLALVHAHNGHPEQALDAAQRALTLDKDLPLIQVALAQTYLLRNEVDLALQATAQALARDPDNVMALLIQAQGQIRVQAYDAALVSAGQALREAPNFSPAHIVLAQAHWAAWELPEAQRELDAALGKTPQYLPARLYRVQMAASAGQMDAATMMMARLERDWPGVPAVLNAAGQLALLRQDYPTALGKFQQLLTLDADFAPAYLGLGQAQYGLRNCWAAQVALSQALVLLPDSGAGYLTLAQSQECLGDTQSAGENYARSITFPWDTPAILQTVTAYAARRGDRAGAQLLRRIQLSYRPDTVQLYVDLGYGYLNVGSGMEAATGNFHQALALDPENVAALIGLGRIYNAYAMPQQAIETFQSALALEPQSNEARVGIGIAYVMTERYEEAITYLEPILENPPADPGAYRYLVRAYRQLNQYPQAGIAFEQFLIRQPPSPVNTILSTVARSYINKSYWIQQEAATATLQDMLAVTSAEQPLPLMLTSLEIVKKDRERALDIVLIFNDDPANSDAMHEAITLAAICGSVITPRVLPPITGGLNLTIRDHNDTKMFAIQIPTSVAQDISDGLLQDYSTLVERVSLHDLRPTTVFTATQGVLIAGSAPPTQPANFTDPVPPEMQFLLEGDVATQRTLTAMPTGGPYSNFWGYEIPAQPERELMSWSRLEGRWHRIRSAGIENEAMQMYLSKQTSFDLAKQATGGLQTMAYSFFENRADRRGLLILETHWDSAESARKFVMAQRLVYATHPAYQEVQRDLRGGQRNLRWVSTARSVHLYQHIRTVWIVFATRSEDLDAATTLFP
ncbi:MAG: tetratricopeptide repeat protein [Anaerolineae bacterium]|nr:tetratricopeptide repeat protein [Anaerolineae bacterium]